MNSLLNEIIFAVLTGCLLIFIIDAIYEHQESLKYQRQVDQYKEQIDQLHIDALKAESDARKAWLEANKTMQLANAKSSQIMKQKVPHDCDKAIAWAIQKAEHSA